MLTQRTPASIRRRASKNLSVAFGRSLDLDGSESFDILSVNGDLEPRQECSLVIYRVNGYTDVVPLILRLDTPIEVQYYRHGGILLYVLRQLLRNGGRKACAGNKAIKSG